MMAHADKLPAVTSATTLADRLRAHQIDTTAWGHGTAKNVLLISGRSW